MIVMHEKSRRQAGTTLLEVSIVSAMTLLLFGSIAAVFTAMTQGTATADRSLVAQSENGRALMSVFNDLQTTDTLGVDTSGNPYVQIWNQGAGTQNAITFRRVEGFVADSTLDVVTSTFGTPIQYFVDANNNLVRVQNGTTTIIANRVSVVRFTLSAAGAITVDLTTFTGRSNERLEVTNQISVTPRNAMSL